MRKITLLFTFLLMLSTAATAATGWYSDYVKLNVNGAGESYYWIGTDPAFGSQLQGTALGSVSSLLITGCDMKYWSDTQDRTGGAFYYKVTNTAGTVDYIATTEVIWDQSFLGGNDYQGLKSTSIDLLTSLPYGTGSYKLQVWSKSWGTNQGDIYLSNDGANYVATFSYTKTNPTSFSGTYKVGESSGTNFTTLGAAVSAINAGTIAGNVLLEITSNLTESSDISLGVNTGLNSLTIKPAASVTPTIIFTNTGASVSIDGHFVIGSPNALNSNLISTNNVTIDGSNTVGGTTKDMTFIGSASSVARSVFRIFGNSDGITIKNCNITTGSTSSSTFGAIQITNFFATNNYTPDNITVLNNTLTATTGNGAGGVSVSVSGSNTTFMTGIKVQNNLISARASRAIFFNTVSDGEISGNTITHDSPLGGTACATIVAMTGGSIAGTFNIFNNKFSMLKTYNTTAGPAASTGIIAIDNQLATPKIMNIYNNFITGFTINGATVQGVKIYGIRQTGTSTTNIYNNTIVMPQMTDMTTQTGSFIAGIAFASAAASEASPGSAAVMTVKNNIIISNETGMKTYGIRRAGSTGTFSSNNNVFYCANSSSTTGLIGLYNAVDYVTLANWQAVPTVLPDAASKSQIVYFVSTSDLRLAGTSVDDMNLGVPRIASVLTDILGTSRNTTTYAGAHEANMLMAYFKTKASGNWNDVATWQISPDNATWVDAVSQTPTATASSVNISTGHLVTVAANATSSALTIKPGAQLTISDTKTLTVTGNFTIESNTDNGTGTFVNAINTGGLSVSGTTTVNQILSARSWYMSSPVVSATPAGMSGIVSYDETWTDPALNHWPSATTMTVGKGYLVNPGVETNIAYTGTLNNGSIPVTLTRSVDNTDKPGFNLIGNPYPSYIDWTTIYSANSGTANMPSSTMWYRSKSSGAWNFHTVNGAGDVSVPIWVSKVIPPMQAFWVRTNTGGGTINFTNSMRLHSAVANPLKAPVASNAERQLIRLQVSNGIYSDELVVYSNQNATNSFDAYDSPKMLNGSTSAIPDMYTLVGNEELVINGMNTIPSEIPLYIKPNASTSGQFSLSATEVSNFESGTLVYIKNNKTGDQQLISDGSVYNFDVTSEPSLSIIIKAPGSVTGVDNNQSGRMNVYANAKGQITVTIPSLKGGEEARVYNSSGQCILNQSLTNSRTMLNKFFTAGVYVVKVNDTIRKVVIE